MGLAGRNPAINVECMHGYHRGGVPIDRLIVRRESYLPYPAGCRRSVSFQTFNTPLLPNAQKAKPCVSACELARWVSQVPGADSQTGYTGRKHMQ